MIYSLSVTKKGTVTIPKKIRDELQASTKVLIVKTTNGYTLKAVKKVSTLAGSMKGKKFTDEEIKDVLGKGFMLNKK
jgi:AbrB family looped-hinge helix DNA binding protein